MITSDNILEILDKWKKLRGSRFKPLFSDRQCVEELLTAFTGDKKQ